MFNKKHFQIKSTKGCFPFTAVHTYSAHTFIFYVFFYFYSLPPLFIPCRFIFNFRVDLYTAEAALCTQTRPWRVYSARVHLLSLWKLLVFYRNITCGDLMKMVCLTLLSERKVYFSRTSTLRWVYQDVRALDDASKCLGIFWIRFANLLLI